MTETTLGAKISSARARAVKSERIGPFEVKSGDSYLHVNVRERATEEQIATASVVVAERVATWLRARAVGALGEVMP